MTPSVRSFFDLFDFDWFASLGMMAPKFTPDIGNHPAYNNHSSLPGVLYTLKSFKCMLVATNHQAKDLSKTGIPERE